MNSYGWLNIVVEIKTGFRLIQTSHAEEIYIYSRLSRSETTRGSCTGLVQVGPTKLNNKIAYIWLMIHLNYLN